MKRMTKQVIGIFLSASIAMISCKKEEDAIVSPPLPARATINFHIKDTNLSGWGEPVYLYRLVFTSTTNYYDASQDIYLRPNIDTSFKYYVNGNTNNLFTIGGAPFDGIIIFMEHKFVVADSNINWEIIY